MVAALFAALLIVHGAIHLLGVARAFRLAEVPGLTQPIGPAMGLTWLAATVLFVATAGALFLWPRWWWAMGGLAVIVSTAATATAWADAKVGAAVNLVVLVGVVFGFLASGPFSLRAEYDHDVSQVLVHGPTASVVTDADLATLPEMVQRYVRRVGVVGQPRARTARARMTGRIRSSPDAAWMPFTAEQVNAIHPAARLFYLTATMKGVPVQGYHRYAGSEATMRIKAAALVPVAEAAGADMTTSETVTLLNDFCLLMPPMLVDAPIRWEVVDARHVRATYTNAGRTVRAVLAFDDAGDLVNFWSDDRRQASPDGRTMARKRWLTPVAGYRQFGPYRLPAAGEARWQDAAGEWAYITLTFDDVTFNVE